MKRKEMFDSLQEILKKNSDLQNDQILLAKNLMEEMLKRLDSIKEQICKNIYAACVREVEGNTDEPKEREAIRLKDAKELLGQWSHHSLEWLIEHGAEGYRKGPKEAYIYIDSIKNIKNIRNRKKGMISLAGAAWRADITYREAKKKCEEMGIPLIRTKRTVWLTEADSAKLVLQYKI